MLLKDVAVILRDGVTIYVDVLRPAGAEKVPVIVAWSPYGKGQGTSRSVMGVFGLVGLDNGIVSRFDRITVPAYVVASYSNTLHTAGTFRAWRRMASGRSGCASTTARSGPITTTRRTGRICADSLTTT